MNLPPPFGFKTNEFDIYDPESPDGNRIGLWSFREVSSAESLVPINPEEFPEDLREIIEAIRDSVKQFPVIELTKLIIFDSNRRRKGHGRKAMEDFFSLARSYGYETAVVQIGKIGQKVSLEGNCAFYTNLGWKRFVTPTAHSLRFAYYELKSPLNPDRQPGCSIAPACSP